MRESWYYNVAESVGKAVDRDQKPNDGTEGVRDLTGEPDYTCHPRTTTIGAWKHGQILRFTWES